MPTNHLTEKQIAELELCKTRGFIIYRGKKLPPFNNPYYAWCMANFKPFVRLHLKTKYGSIMLDTPHTSRHVDLRGKKELRAFMEKWQQPLTEWNAVPGDIPRVSVEAIEAMARELNHILSACFARLHAEGALMT